MMIEYFLIISNIIRNRQNTEYRHAICAEGCMRRQKLGTWVSCFFVQVYLLDSFLSINPSPRLPQNSIWKTTYLFVVLPILDSFLFTVFEYQVLTVPLIVLSHIINTSSRNSWSCCSHKHFMILWFEIKIHNNHKIVKAWNGKNYNRWKIRWVMTKRML